MTIIQIVCLVIMLICTVIIIVSTVMSQISIRNSKRRLAELEEARRRAEELCQK